MNNRLILAFAVALFAAASANAQTTDTQTFRVTVPTNISITAPTDVTISHDESNNNQVFPTQQWTVSGNVLAGVNVTFETATAFTHTVDSSFKRDASLSLSVASNSGPGVWTVTQANDATDYANATTPDEIATVQASSDGVGVATFDLGVSFVTNQFGEFAAGDYDTTVTGTVTAN